MIEYMDTGNVNGWKLGEVAASHDLLQNLRTKMDLKPVHRLLGETAERYAIDGEEGFEVGFISSVTKPFCNACNRARLSADGKIFTCLFASQGLDVKEILREGICNTELDKVLGALWSVRNDNYSEQRSDLTEGLPKAEMSYLGG